MEKRAIEVRDVSKTTVLILLILTILVSVMGVVTVMEAATKTVPPPQAEAVQGNQQATVSLEIAPKPVTETATVSLEIAPPAEEGG